MSLIQSLQRDGIWASGMIHSNHIGLHPNVKKPPKLTRGEHKIYQDKKTPNLTCCVWADTKYVRYASVACDPTVVGVTIHQISRNYVHVNQPLVAQHYNKHYKSINLLDQHLSSYPISCRTCQSWKHIWWFCFQTAVVNAYILYKEMHSGPLPKSYAYVDFRIALAKEMIGTFSMRQITPLLKPLYVLQMNNLWVIRITKLTLLLLEYADLIKSIMALQNAQFMVVKFVQYQFANNAI